MAYEYLKNAPVGAFNSFDLHACETTENYNPVIGQRCKDATTGRWRKFLLNITKNAHIRFVDTRAFSEIWVATDGTPTLTANSEFCTNATVPTGGTANQRVGISCRMLQYNIAGPITAFTNSMHFYLNVDNAALGGVSLNGYDIRLNGGTGTWYQYSSTTTDINSMFVAGDGWVNVFFSNEFFRKMLAAGGSTAGKQDIFTFVVENTATPQSGYYQFSAGLDIDIIPREYGISIRHQDQNER